jgi:hypothetical protein
LKPLLDPDPGGGFTSETAARRFQKRNDRYVTVSEVKRLQVYDGPAIMPGREDDVRVDVRKR